MACSTACHSPGLSLPAWAKTCNAEMKINKTALTVASCFFLFICILLRSFESFSGSKDLSLRCGRSCFCVRQPRYFEPEGTSVSFCTLNIYATTMSRANRFHDGEAQTCTSHLTRPRLIRPVKPLKNVRLPFLRDTDACIGDRQDRFVCFGTNADAD